MTRVVLLKDSEAPLKLTQHSVDPCKGGFEAQIMA